MKSPSDPELLKAILRQDFAAFVGKVFGTLSPGQTFIPSWHIDALADALERVRRNEINRLIINMPPRSIKSMTASVERQVQDDDRSGGHHPQSRA